MKSSSGRARCLREVLRTTKRTVPTAHTSGPPGAASSTCELVRQESGLVHHAAQFLRLFETGEHVSVALLCSTDHCFGQRCYAGHSRCLLNTRSRSPPRPLQAGRHPVSIPVPLLPRTGFSPLVPSLTLSTTIAWRGLGKAAGGGGPDLALQARRACEQAAAPGKARRSPIRPTWYVLEQRRIMLTLNTR